MRHIKAEILGETVILGSDGTIDRPTFTQNGYVYFSIKGERIALHRTIAQYFLNNGKPIDGLDVHHKDFSRDNNAADNLMILTKHQHIALHRYLETPEGYRKLNEDIEEWKEKAEYYKKKAQKIEKANVLLEKTINEQTNMLFKYKDIIEQTSNLQEKFCNNFYDIFDKITIKIDEINNKLENLPKQKETKDKLRYVFGEKEKNDVINECLEKYGKVTRKNLFLLGVKNFDSVYHLWYKDNK